MCCQLVKVHFQRSERTRQMYDEADAQHTNWACTGRGDVTACNGHPRKQHDMSASVIHHIAVKSRRPGALLLLALAGIILAACSNTSSPNAATGIGDAQHTPPTAATPTTIGAMPTPSITASGTPQSTALPSPTPTVTPTATSSPPPVTEVTWSFPIGMPGRPLGDGFVIRHVYAAENTWFNPGWWHTAEDWYLQAGDSTGARVYAAADGEVVFAGANYPGRVVIVQHADTLYSMYGHLDPQLAVQVGQRVARGDLLGTVGPGNERAAGHLHFEIRTFLTKREINGAAPRYGYKCGTNCPPGPGYWPIDAPEHPSALGWRNPTYAIASRAFGAHQGWLGEVVVATQPAAPRVVLWSAPPERSAERQSLGELGLTPGERFVLLDVHAGADDTLDTSAQNVDLWYYIQLGDGRPAWVQAAVPATLETGSDGRPSSVQFNFWPAVIAQ